MFYDCGGDAYRSFDYGYSTGPDVHEDPCRYCDGCPRCTEPTEPDAARAAETR